MLQRASQSKSLERRVDKHLLACAAAAAVVGAYGAEKAEAVIAYSGPLNFAVNPTTLAGAYINVQTFGIATTAAADPAWNLNLFNVAYSGFQTGNMIYPNLASHGPTPGTDRVVGTGGLVSKLVAGTPINGASPLATPNVNSLLAMQVFSVSGYSYGLPWQADGSTGFVGFKVDFAGGSHFGWMRVKMDAWVPGIMPPPSPSFPAPLGQAPMTIIDMAYETSFNTQILAGQVPEPTTAAALGLLALGAAGVRPRRKD